MVVASAGEGMPARDGVGESAWLGDLVRGTALLLDDKAQLRITPSSPIRRPSQVQSRPCKPSIRAALETAYHCSRSVTANHAEGWRRVYGRPADRYSWSRNISSTPTRGRIDVHASEALAATCNQSRLDRDSSGTGRSEQVADRGRVAGGR